MEGFGTQPVFLATEYAIVTYSLISMGVQRLQKLLLAVVLLYGLAIVSYIVYRHPTLIRKIESYSASIDPVTTISNEQRRTTTSSPTTLPERQLRVLCLILGTMKQKEKMEAVNATWAKRCDIPLFVISKDVPKEQNTTDVKRVKSANVTKQPETTSVTLKPSLDHLGTQTRHGILEVPVPGTRPYLPMKVQMAFEYVYRRYNNTFDWILKCDDDTYVIMENLKLLLSRYDPTKPITLGIRFKLKGHFLSGGAGYVISSTGIRNTVETVYQSPECRTQTGNEDIEMGRCFRKAGVQIVESLDEVGKETFHPEPLDRYLYPEHPTWLYEYLLYKPVFGPGCCSGHSITFHHISPADMYLYETLLYDININKG